MTCKFPEYGWCLAVASGIGIQCYLFGVIGGSKRARMFNKAFFEREFPDIRPSDRNSGLPDMGNGRYSEKLSLEEWHELNCAVRASAATSEVVYLPILTTLIGGIVFPRIASGLGILYIAGRALYSIGYLLRGPSGRYLGGFISDISLIGLCGTALYASWILGDGKKGLCDMLPRKDQTIFPK